MIGTLDLDAGIPGPDTIYTLSTVSTQLQKYSFNGTNWSSNGSIASSAVDLVATNVGSAVTLYLTTTGSLLTLTDSSGFNATITGSLTTLATAATNTAFRGLGVFPVPEPSSLGLAAVGAVAAAFGWRRRRHSKRSS